MAMRSKLRRQSQAKKIQLAAEEKLYKHQGAAGALRTLEVSSTLGDRCADEAFFFV